MRGLILLFGGGDRGIIDDLLVYSTENGNWFQPSTSGQVETSFIVPIGSFNNNIRYQTEWLHLEWPPMELESLFTVDNKNTESKSKLIKTHIFQFYSYISY